MSTKSRSNFGRLILVRPEGHASADLNAVLRAWDVSVVSPAGRSDLWKVTPGAAGSGTGLGYFELNNAGGMSFVPANIPEPGTWSLLGLGALALESVFGQLSCRSRRPVQPRSGTALLFRARHASRLGWV